MLVLILSGSSEYEKAKQGLVFALNAAKAGMLDEVDLLFFASGVRLLDPDSEHHLEVAELVKACQEEGLAPRVCSGNLARMDLAEAARNLSLDPVGAQTYIPARIREGYCVVSF